ncbi:hypothetical protein [Novosphingobium sp.]|uniref:hypothetical protein n=1 Tax=Novosphingobium sp. TaxID=1874826 RepID=UPI003D0A331D
MAFTPIEVTAGLVDLYNIDTQGPGPLAGLGNGPTTRGFTNYPGMEIKANDPFLGAGTFIFGRASTTIAAGGVCEVGVNVSATNRYDVQFTPWAGTANSGKGLSVALVALTVGQFGWFQVEGNAIANVSGAPVAGNPMYWQAAGVISPTAVASKHMLNATAMSAVSATIGNGSASLLAYTPGSTAGILPANQAVLFLNRPLAQGAIT